MNKSVLKSRAQENIKNKQAPKCRIPNYNTKGGGALQAKTPITRGNSPMHIMLASTPASEAQYSRSRSRSHSRSDISNKSPYFNTQKSSASRKPTPSRIPKITKDSKNTSNIKKVIEPVRNRYRTEKYLNNLGSIRTYADK